MLGGCENTEDAGQVGKVGGIGGEAFATMVTSDSYVVGAIVVADSLYSTCGQKRPVMCMVTASVSQASRKMLSGAGLQLEEVHDIASKGMSDVEAWNQSGYTKLNLWRLTHYSKLVYVDADCLVVQSINDLFGRETDFAAAPDTFPPDRFNAGFLLLRPSLEVFEDMMTKIGSTISYDGGDTGFLNAYFNQWYTSGAENRLPFGYNALRTMYWMTKKNPGYWEAAGPIKCIHFCSFPKPWEKAPNGPLEQQWWVAFAKAQVIMKMKGFSVILQKDFKSTGEEHETGDKEIPVKTEP